MKSSLIQILLFSLLLLSALLSTPTLHAQTPARSPSATSPALGVHVGDSVHYGDFRFHSNSTSSSFQQFATIVGVDETVTQIKLDNVTVNQVLTFNNGTAPRTMPMQGNITSGSGNLTFFILRGGLTTGEPIYKLGYSFSGAPNFSINETVARSYYGSVRPVNAVLLKASIFGSIGFTSGQSSFYWDQTSGFLDEISTSGILPAGLLTGSTSAEEFSFSFKLTSTNVWSPSAIPDYSVDVTPVSTFILYQGDTNSIKVNLTSFGFAGTVNLQSSISRLNSTVAAPPSVSAVTRASITLTPGASQASTLTISTTIGTTTGIYLINVNGTGSQSHAATFAIKVAPPGFALIPNSPFIGVPQGSTVISAITVKALGSFTGTVTLTPENSPYWVEAAVKPQSVPLTPGASVKVQLNLTATGLNPGPSFAIVNGTSNGKNVILYVSVEVQGPDFSLKTDQSPLSPLTLQLGGSVTFKVTVVSLVGFSGKVTVNVYEYTGHLAASPAKTTLTLAPVGTASIQSFDVTVATTPGTIPGPYFISLVANASSLRHYDGVSIDVPPPTSFDINSADHFLTLNSAGSGPTSSGSTTITVSPVNGFTGTVVLSNSTTPSSGLNCQLSSKTVTLGSPQSSTLSCTAVNAGSYIVTVKGTSALDSKSTTVFVTVASRQYLPGVTVGQTATFKPVSVTWQSSSPLIPEPQNFKDLSLTDHITVDVTGISGTAVTLHLTWYFMNSTAPAQGTLVVDVLTGLVTTSSPILGGGFGILIAGGLQAHDSITGAHPSPTLNMTDSRSILGVMRMVNFLNFTQTALGGSSTISSGLAWDQASGMIVEAASTATFAAGSLSAHGSFRVVITATNIWSTPTPDFQISAGLVTPSTILPGSSGTTTITVTRINGFTGTVTLTAGSSAPVGLTCPSVTVSGSDTSAILSCSASVAGDYTIVVTGTATINGSPATRMTGNLVFHVADFTISSSPTSKTVDANAAGSSTITVTAVNQFNGAVNLLTDNTACTIDHPSIQGSGTATLSCTFTTAQTTAVTVTGTSDALSHHATVTFTVNNPAAPNFTISVTGPVSFTSGTSGTSSITVTAQNGFYSSLTLSATVTPATGLTVAFSPQTFQYGSGSSTATFTSTTPGTYTVTITGTSGSLVHSQTVRVTVNAAVQPTSQAPTILGLDPTLFYGLVGGIIAIVVIGGAVVLMRGKKPQTPP